MIKIMNKLKSIFIILVITLAFIEILSLLFTKMKILKFYNIPTYTLDKKESWFSRDEDLGVWHKKNFIFTEKTSCYKVEYKSNDVGARSEIDYLKLKKDNNVFIVGDSFVEGYGANYDEIFSELITKNTKKTGLNFGTSGHFGPVQYYLVYKKFHNLIPHNELIIFFLPANDFLDNSIRNPLYKSKIYRPYFKKKDGNYRIFYPKEEITQETGKRSFVRLVKDILINYTYTSNTLRTISYTLFYSSKIDREYDVFKGYFHENEEEVDASLHYIQKIIDLAGNIKKTIILIPSVDDLEKIYVDNLDYKELYWFKNFEKFSKINNLKLIDLASFENTYLIKKGYYQSFFNKCDKHWNKKGHKFAFSKYFETL